MSTDQDAGIRARLTFELVGDGKAYATDTELAKDMESRSLFDRGNATKMIRGQRKVTVGFLDAIEAGFGFKLRVYIETGEWPSDDEQAAAIARLKKPEFETLPRTP